MCYGYPPEARGCLGTTWCSVRAPRATAGRRPWSHRLWMEASRYVPWGSPLRSLLLTSCSERGLLVLPSPFFSRFSRVINRSLTHLQILLFMRPLNGHKRPFAPRSPGRIHLWGVAQAGTPARRRVYRRGVSARRRRVDVKGDCKVFVIVSKSCGVAGVAVSSMARRRSDMAVSLNWPQFWQQSGFVGLAFVS